MILAVLISENVQIERKDHHRLDVLGDLIPSENPMRDRLRAVVPNELCNDLPLSKTRRTASARAKLDSNSTML